MNCEAQKPSFQQIETNQSFVNDFIDLFLKPLLFRKNPKCLTLSVDCLIPWTWLICSPIETNSLFSTDMRLNTKWLIRKLLFFLRKINAIRGITQQRKYIVLVPETGLVKDKLLIVFPKFFFVDLEFFFFFFFFENRNWIWFLFERDKGKVFDYDYKLFSMFHCVSCFQGEVDVKEFKVLEKHFEIFGLTFKLIKFFISCGLFPKFFPNAPVVDPTEKIILNKMIQKMDFLFGKLLLISGISCVLFVTIQKRKIFDDWRNVWSKICKKKIFTIFFFFICFFY